MRKKKDKEMTSIAIAVSFDGSSKDALQIVMLHTSGSTVTTTKLASISRAGINYIQSQGWQKMFETNGVREIAEQMEIGNDGTK